MTPGGFLAAPGSRFPETPSVCIGVNQGARSPAKSGRGSVPSPTPAGGLFSFAIPAGSISRQLTARERYELTERSDYQRKELKPLEVLGVKDITDEEYVTPRNQLDDKDKPNASVRPKVYKEGPRRLKGLTAFFEQFGDPSLEA